MKKTGVWLAVVVGLQVLWMVGTAISKELNLRGGTTVLLETMPVDPRDLLRGDYVILNYKISSVPATWMQAGGPNAMLNGRDVYVALEKRGKFYEAVGASLTPIEDTKAGRMVVRGTVDAGAFSAGGTVRVTYGIERFYVREGTGNPGGKLTVECVVNGDGTLQIKEVFVDGKAYAKAMREAKGE